MDQVPFLSAREEEVCWNWMSVPRRSACVRVPFASRNFSVHVVCVSIWLNGQMDKCVGGR